MEHRRRFCFPNSDEAVSRNSAPGRFLTRYLKDVHQPADRDFFSKHKKRGGPGDPANSLRGGDTWRVEDRSKRELPTTSSVRTHATTSAGIRAEDANRAPQNNRLGGCAGGSELRFEGSARGVVPRGAGGVRFCPTRGGTGGPSVIVSDGL